MSRLELDALRRVFAAHAPVDWPALPRVVDGVERRPGAGEGRRWAGVLVPLVLGPRPLRTLLTLRPDHLRRHPGEVSFPGGRPEPGEDAEATAAREAREELGLELTAVLGRLSSVPLWTSEFRLVPVVAAVGDGPLSPDPGEVAAVLELELDALLARDRLDAIAWHFDGRTVLSPVIELDGGLVFGGTAHVLIELLRVLAEPLGRPPPRLVAGGWRWDEAAGRPRRT